MEARLKRLLSIILICIMIMSIGISGVNLSVYASGINDSSKAVVGDWTGSYTSKESDGKQYERQIVVHIYKCSGGEISGIFEYTMPKFQGGLYGSYYFEGTFDSSTGDYSFKGKDMIVEDGYYNHSTFSTYKGTFDLEKGEMTGKIASYTYTFKQQAAGKKTYALKPEDIIGIYSGTHYGSISFNNVLRNSTIVIDTCTQDGMIDGRFIIYPIPDADNQINAIYRFSGYVDMNTGKLYFVGKDWIKYPDVPANYSFQDYRGNVDVNKKQISGKTVNGDFSYVLVSDKKNSGFTLGIDNNSFINSKNPDYSYSGFAGVQNHSLDDEYFEKLTKNSSEGEKNLIKTKMDKEWSGSCYGIVTTMGLLYEGYINTSDLTEKSGVSSYYSLPLPVKDKKLLNTINYYHLSQYLENGGKKSCAVSSAYGSGFLTGLSNYLFKDDNLTLFLKKLVEYASDDHVEMLGYTISGDGHAVLITGCEYVQSENKYKVQIFDANCIRDDVRTGEFSYMMINDDFSDFTYTDSTGHKINSWTFRSIYFMDWNSMGNVMGNLSGDLSNGSYGSLDSSDFARIDFPMSASFEMQDGYGKKLKYDGEKLSGDIKVYDVDTIDYDNGSRIVIKTNRTSKLTFTNIGKSVDVDVTVSDSFMGLKGTSIDKAVFELKNGIKLEGKNLEYTAYVTTDAVDKDEKGLISVSGKSKSKVEVAPDGTGVSVETDGNLAEIKTETFVGSKVIEKKFKNVGKKFKINKDAKVETAKTSLSKATVKLSKTAYVYDGKTKKPAVTVKINSKKLKKGRDYTVTYKNNKKVGTASVIITGKGSYKGKITKKFKINPKGTTLKKVLAKKKKMTIKWKKQTKLTTGYQIQYSTSKNFRGAKTQTITKNKKTKCIIKKLKSKKKYYVRIRTYKKVKGKKYYSKWSKAKTVKVK